jgi:hypothetical protein
VTRHRADADARTADAATGQPQAGGGGCCDSSIAHQPLRELPLILAVGFALRRRRCSNA